MVVFLGSYLTPDVRPQVELLGPICQHIVLTLKLMFGCQRQVSGGAVSGGGAGKSVSHHGTG